MKKRYFGKAVISTMLIASTMFVPVTGTITYYSNIPFAIEAEAATQYTYSYYPKYSGSSVSIVDILKILGVDSSFSNRKAIYNLQGLNLGSYSGSTTQNNALVKLVKSGKLIRSKKAVSSSSGTKANTAGTTVYNKAKSLEGKKYGWFSGLGFHWRAWCADFVSWCAKQAGQSKAIPWNASVSGIRTAIKNAGGKEYLKSAIANGKYVPSKGDIIIFKSNGASHVGIVEKKSGNRIYYVDGNNTRYGNGNNSCVNYSSCLVSDSRFTCVLKPYYR